MIQVSAVRPTKNVEAAKKGFWARGSLVLIRRYDT